ncbi:hypothetical protein CCP3SC1_720006 [Gammaproteobacteria bacterium]
MNLRYPLSCVHLMLKRGLMRLFSWGLRLRVSLQPAHWPTQIQGTVAMIDLCLGLGDILMISPGLRRLLDHGPVVVVTRWPRLLEADLEWRIASAWREQIQTVTALAATGHVIWAPFLGLRGLLTLLTWPGVLPAGIIVLDAHTWLDTVSGSLGMISGRHYSDPPIAAAHALLHRLSGATFTPAEDVPRLPPFVAEAPSFLPEGPFVVLAPWAAAATRRWPLAHWAELIDRLTHEQPDLQWVFIGSPDENEHVVAILAQVRNKANLINRAGRETLAETTALIAHARLLISCDSGPMHLAIGLGTPVVALFGSTASETRLQGHGVLAIADPTLCPTRRAPCYVGFQRDPVCPTHIECLAGLSPARVATQVIKQLEQHPGDHS